MSQRKVILSMQMTIDGYVAGPNDEADWIISSEDEWQDLFKDLHSADTYLLGRKMCPIYSEYWQSVLKNPGSKGGDLEFAKLAEKTQHIVFTKAISNPIGKTQGFHTIQREKSQP